MSSTHEDAIAAWNHRTFPHPIGYALADYLRTGNVQALMMVLDVEWDARERAKGELDRALTEAELFRYGFYKGQGNTVFHFELKERDVLITAYNRMTHFGVEYGMGGACMRVETLRQFLHLCGLFGITPRADG